MQQRKHIMWFSSMLVFMHAGFFESVLGEAGNTVHNIKKIDYKLNLAMRTYI